VMVPFDPSQSINNPNQTHYTTSDTDGITVKHVDQSGLRTVTYDPAAYKQDWKDLKRHFQTDLTKAEQQSDDGQAYLTEINSHL
jgi:hypothetical protein